MKFVVADSLTNNLDVDIEIDFEIDSESKEKIMTVSIRIEVPGCSVVPVVNGEVWTAWPFNDNHAADLAAWKEECRRTMSAVAAQAGVQAEFDPAWEAVAEEFFSTSQASEYR